jgi:signal transduction histidine kinase
LAIDLSLIQRILLDRKIAYAITDHQLQVIEFGGAVEILQPGSPSIAGRSLLELVPELVGSERALKDILAGDLPRLELAWINRETSDGWTLYFTVVDLPHRDEQGRIVGILHLMEDCTEAGQLKQHLSQSGNELRLAQEQLAHQNQELATANAELRRLDDLKSTFVSVAAHELRTPLTAVQGYVEMLIDEEVGPLGDGQRQYLAIVQGSAERLLHITSNLLDVTRIEAGRVDLVLQPTDLSTLVQSVVSEYKPQVTAKLQHLTLQYSPGLPPVLCDPTRTVRIIGNLLSNATKYTPSEGHIDVAVDRAEEDGFLQVSVTDDGVGIGPEDQDMLFRRFFRAASATETEASGAGLGLYITRSLVELQGGRIWFASEYGGGSSFYVTFPIAG